MLRKSVERFCDNNMRVTKELSAMRFSGSNRKKARVKIPRLNIG
jgi:hypothetical protein